MDRPETRRNDAVASDAPEPVSTPDDDWVHELIAMTRPGAEIEFPSRTLAERPLPFEYDDFS